MPERAAITPDRRQEPAKPERFRIAARTADLARDQQDLGANLHDQKIERDFLIGMRDRIDQPVAPGGVLASQHLKGAVAHPHDRGRRQGCQAPCGDIDDQLGLQPYQHRRSDDFVLGGRSALQRELAR
jgi:hypothetical protein